MKKFSKFIAAALAVMMTLVYSVSAYADAPSPKIDAIDANVDVIGTSGTYNGDYHSASYVIVTHDGNNLTEGVDYDITTNKTNGVNAGIKKVVVVITFKGDYTGTIKKEVDYTILPANNNLSAGLTQREVTYNPDKAITTGTKVTYDSLSGGVTLGKYNNYFSINRYGTITVKPGTPAGTYFLPVSVAASNNYNASNTVSIRIRVLKAYSAIRVLEPVMGISAASLAKSSQTLQMILRREAGDGAFQYTVGKSAVNYLTTADVGKVTVAKGTAKGTYFVSVKSAMSANYRSSSSQVVKIVVV